MATLAANFEAGTNGNTIAAADAGSVDAWNTVSTPPASGVLAYDNAHAAHGSLAAKLSTGATAGAEAMTWTTAFGAQTDHYGRVYLYMTANPAASPRIIRVANVGTLAAGLSISTVGKIQLLNSPAAVVATSTNAITLNAWVRIEFHFIHSATVGQLEAKLFNTADSTTVTETLTTAASLNTLASADRIAFGINTSQANVAAFWLDDILAGETSYPGYAGQAPPFKRPRNRLITR